jgi:hypothetical protein
MLYCQAEFWFLYLGDETKIWLQIKLPLKAGILQRPMFTI